MRKCTVCGYSVEESSNICPACGAIIKDVPVRTPPREDVKNSSAPTYEKSIFVKYADFIDNEAMFKVAVCKREGIGVQRNDDEAFEMFRVLAFRGHYDAMYKLSEMYLEQDPADKESAYRWLKIAADGGHVPSKLKIKVLGDIGGPDNEKISFQGESENLEALITAALPSIVSIYSFKNKQCSVGSGFIVEGGYVVSNAHVIGKNPDCITAKFEPGVDDKSYNLKPVSIASEYDVAIMRFTGLVDKKISARKNLSLRLEDIGFGEEVYTIGNPHGIGLSASHGVISCPNRETDYPACVDEVIQTDITANHGNSGGALLDKCNNVIGMVTFHPSGIDGGIAMCVPSKYIVNVLNKIK